MPEKDFFFTSENLDEYLKELSKEFRKLNGKQMRAEITLVGGAAVIANYGFRDGTQDIDAIIHASSAMKQAAAIVADKYDLPHHWINSDFTQTASYSPKLENYSKYYKTFANIVEVRTITAEYLVAMKLMSGRPYKNDLSDIMEIVAAEKLSYDIIMDAVKKLYGDECKLPEYSAAYLDKLLNSDNLEDEKHSIRELEENNLKLLSQFESTHKNVLNSDNLLEILESLQTDAPNENDMTAENPDAKK